MWTMRRIRNSSAKACSVMPYFGAVADAIVHVTLVVVGVVKLNIDIVDHRAEVRLHRVVGDRPLAEIFHAILDVGNAGFLYPFGRARARMRDDLFRGGLVPRRADLLQVVIVAAIEHAALAVLLVVPRLHQLLGALVARGRYVGRLLNILDAEYFSLAGGYWRAWIRSFDVKPQPACDFRHRAHQHFGVEAAKDPRP